MTGRFALRGLTLIDGTGGDPIEGAVVVVEDGTFVEVGKKEQRGLRRTATVIDAEGLVAVPGIIDCHCHLGGASYPDEAMWVLEPDAFQAIASVAQTRALLQHGVTSVRDISANGPHLKQAIRKGFIEGPRIVPCWRGISRRGGHGDATLVEPDTVRRSHPWGMVADGPDEVRKAVREAIKNGAECIKVWASGGGLHENEPEDAQHYGLAELQAIVEEAGMVRIPVAAHCEGKSSARDAVEAGVWSIEHGEDLDEETLAIMGRNGVFLNPTLVLLSKWFNWEMEGGFYGTGVPYVPGGGELPSDVEGLRAVHAQRLRANLLAAKEAGARIGVGSDSFNTTLTPYGQQTLEEVHALVSAGLTEMDALVAATRTGSEMLRVAHKTGTIEKGKSADMVVLHGDPLADITALAANNMVAILKEGKFVKNLLN